MLSPMTAMATAAVCGSTAVRIIALRMFWMSSMPGSLLADSLSPAEQALGPHQQDEDEDEERRGVLEVAGDHQGRELHHQPDDQGADQRPEGRAQAAQRHGGEEQEQDLQAGVPLDAVDDEGVE